MLVAVAVACAAAGAGGVAGYMYIVPVFGKIFGIHRENSKVR
jgi:Na+/serine symporter